MVEKLEKIISQSQNIVFFGGAGVSTESGIPDFRSVDGLYHQKYDYPPETILSHTFWEERPEEFYRFYRDKLIVKGAKPNAVGTAVMTAKEAHTTYIGAAVPECRGQLLVLNGVAKTYAMPDRKSVV